MTHILTRSKPRLELVKLSKDINTNLTEDIILSLFTK